MSMRMIMPNVGHDMEKLAHSYIAGSSVIGTSTLENSLAVSTEVEYATL